jgi:hypothetical protein
MHEKWSLYLSICTLAILLGCGSPYSQSVEEELAALPDRIDYNFQVKPILSDRCFACHGPDAQKREGNLRLDIEQDAYAALESGAGHAIVPKNLARSQLVTRILATDPEIKMPPQKSNLTLTDKERAVLIKWIEQGAEYKPHWAFIKPQLAVVPTIGSNWAKNEIDQFVYAKLQPQGFLPAPEADRAHLIRRLYFDLTGLPPSLEDLDHWMKAPEKDYYETLVDRLLASPAFGERMAAHWLDVARFADSEGYLDDFHHTFWPYRDWVIKAFNENLPYNDFILWQVGGDQIPNATEEQILATAFNRNHKQNSEGGVIPEEFRVDYVADRTNTVGSAFMSLTVGCARCHDHKYDPFSQENYYQLFSFFNSTVERGDGIFSLNSIEKGQMVPNKYSMNAGPVLALPDEKTAAIRAYLLQQIDEKQDTIAIKAKQNSDQFNQWRAAQKNSNALVDAIKKSTVSHLPFDDMKDTTTTDLTPGAKKATFGGSISAVEGYRGKAIRSDARGQLVADGLKSSFERNEPFTISFFIKVPKVFDDAHVIYNGNNRIQGYRGWDVVIDSNRIHFRLSHAHPYQSLDISNYEGLPINQWIHFVWTYDGSSRAEGMKLYRDGRQIDFEIHRNHVYRSTKPYLYDAATVYMPYRGLIIGNRHYDQDFTGGLLDEVHILNKEADDFVALYLFDSDQAIQKFGQALQEENKLDPFFDLFIDDDLEEKRKSLRAIQTREIETIDTVQEIMVMGDLTKERPTYILDRGVYTAHGKPVSRDVPTSILAWPDDLPRNRYGLGKWLTHPNHPLTARVAVNQIWQLMFGRGIVETVEDFGNQGALPSHPELLDWLAIDFQQHGWDIKRLIRQMVMSATYRQSSKIRPELADIDPDNYLLARGPRYRRSAEMIRDNILASSGLLNDHIGGPSVFPYQPPGLWKEVMTHTFFPEYEVDYDKGLYRRSIYTFWKRNMPPPAMLIFDAASRAECQVRRQQSSTPLQALVLLNDPQIIEGSRVIAEKNWIESEGDEKAATATIFRLLTSRMPSDRELQILMKAYQDELSYFEKNVADYSAYLSIGQKPIATDLPAPNIAALARVTNTIFNTTEAYYKN